MLKLKVDLEKATEMFLEGDLSYKYFVENIVREIEGSELTVPKFQEEWVDAALTHQNVVIAASRGSGKTITFGVLLPLYLATYHANKTFLIISPTEDRAFEILQKIRYTIENNNLLKFLKPTSTAGTWTKSKIDTSNHCLFYSKCLSPNLRGYHVDYLLVEECGQIQDVDMFLSAVLPTIYAKKGKCIAIGTPETSYDLLAKLKKNPHFYSMEFPAIKDGKPLWPERYPLSKLKTIKRTIGESRFNREYLLQLMSDEDRAFPPDVLVASLDSDRGFLKYGDASKTYFVGVDLAESPKGDYTVFTVLEKQTNGSFALVHLERMRGVQPNIQERMLEELYEKFKPLRIEVDRSLFGHTFITNLRSAGLPVVAFDFSPGKRGLILHTLQRAFEDRKIILPYNAEAEPLTKILLHELSYIDISKGKFKSKTTHDDCAISLALAYYAACKYKSCSVYGASSQVNIYNKVSNYGAGESYISQMEKRMERLKEQLGLA